MLTTHEIHKLYAQGHSRADVARIAKIPYAKAAELHKTYVPDPIPDEKERYQPSNLRHTAMIRAVAKGAPIHKAAQATGYTPPEAKVLLESWLHQADMDHPSADTIKAALADNTAHNEHLQIAQNFRPLANVQ